MTVDQAKEIGRKKYPRAFCASRSRQARGDSCYWVQCGVKQFGDWLTNEHNSEEAAWLRAARNVRKGM